jgi:hypothetical protein
MASFFTPLLSHDALHTVDGTVCRNGRPKDLTIASDWPWLTSAAWRQLLDIM